MFKMMWPKKHLLVRLLRNNDLCKQCSTVSKTAKKIKYTDTVLLPKTNFPQFLNAKQIVERDARVQKDCGFLEYYSWQQENVKGEEFVLHDGPPYANGKPHIGHSINKIFKDIALRSQAVQGRRVHFIPGWDCHGLPIELKALSSTKGVLPPQDVRKQARHFAQSAIKTQMKAFQDWGVMADWDNQCYYTFDTDYVVNQLQIFWNLYEKGLIFRDLKPVYWSPSSRTALAESELVYKEDHVSDAVTVRLRVTSAVECAEGRPVYLLIWTTTPWTLPANEAVCFSASIEYCLVSIASHGKALYVVATKLVPDLQLKLNEEVKIVSSVSYDVLSAMKYHHPVREEELSVLESAHVTLAGTGLVHTAPVHGHDDFLVGLKHGLPLKCHVDERGCFTGHYGPHLEGLSVLKDGCSRVVDAVSQDIIAREQYRHNYPYDWRTNKPVIIRECLKGVSTDQSRLESLLQSRPYWCLSRQRAWGVPIPVFYHRLSGRPLVTKHLVDHLCHVMETSGVDAWWTESTDTLFTSDMCRQTMVQSEDVVRGSDIMDIWFDSGVSWSVLDGRVSDVCVEGGDQFTGWFQSSLLTSVAVRRSAPYKKLVIHGFAVDESGRKMSKSVGNVVDPEDITRGNKALGVDALRWWVAGHGHHPNIPVSYRILQANAEAVQKIRITLRFLLGALHDATESELSAPCRMGALDKHVLQECHDVYSQAMVAYNQHTYNHICILLTNFVANLSSLYVHVIKDRLYCDKIASERRMACRQVLHFVLTTLCYTLAPVLPHLAEEAFLHHPLHRDRRLFFSTSMWTPPAHWSTSGDEEVAAVQAALSLKKQVDALCGVKSVQSVVTVQAGEPDYALLKTLQSTDESFDSELTEILQVSAVRLIKAQVTESVVRAAAGTRERCPRCRRYTAEKTDELCVRCESVLGQ